MLCSPIRHTHDRHAGAFASSWSNLNPQASAVSKTRQHNDFLSLLRFGDPSNKRSLNESVMSTTTIRKSSIPTPSIKKTEESFPFGVKPNREILDVKSEEVSLSSPASSQAEKKTDKPGHEQSTKGHQHHDVDAMDIDCLVKGMSEHVVIKDLAVKDSKSIELPNGFPMESEIQPCEFYKTKSDIKAHLKRKRQEGAIPKSLRKGWKNTGGFKPQEVNFSGAVSLRNCRPSNLTNEIHPLLHRSRFDDTPDAIYDQLLPALRLATMFLTQPSCMQFWVTVALGPRIEDPAMTQKYGRRCQRIASHVSLTTENTTKVIAHLHALGQANIINFAFKPTLPTDTPAWATSSPICDYLGAAARPRSSRLTRSIIRLHSDHYIIAKKLSQLRYPETSQKLRFSFFFATLLLHELAHSIEGAYIQLRSEQWAEYQLSKSYMEPFWLDWRRPPECGKAWEQTLFGGEVQPVNNRVDGSHGVGVADWPPRGTEGDPERRVWYTVPMTYIECLFQRGTWDARGKGLEAGWLKVPRTGASSFYVNYFTTMASSEGLRVEREELSELVRCVGEQPPAKVRLTRAGDKEERRPDESEVIENAVAELEGGQRRGRGFAGTRRLSEVMAGALPTSREAQMADRVVGLTCRQLFELAERVDGRRGEEV